MDETLQKEDPKTSASREWAVGWSKVNSQKFERGIEILPCGGLSIASTATLSGIKAAGKMLWGANSQVGHMELIVRFALGDTINALADRESKTFEDVVADEGYCQSLGMAMATITKIAHVARLIPVENRHIGLSWTHYTAACGFRGPDQTKKPLEFIDFQNRRLSILDRAADDPDSRGKQWVIDEMRALQKKSGVKQGKGVAEAVIIKWGAQLFYLSAHASEEDLKTMGKTRADISAAIASFETELINRNIIEPEKLQWPANPS